MLKRLHVYNSNTTIMLFITKTTMTTRWSYLLHEVSGFSETLLMPVPLLVSGMLMVAGLLQMSMVPVLEMVMSQYSQKFLCGEE